MIASESKPLKTPLTGRAHKSAQKTAFCTVEIREAVTL